MDEPDTVPNWFELGILSKAVHCTFCQGSKSFADEIIDEEEYVLLFDAYKSSNPAYPYWEYDAFCLDSFDSSECLTEFRVSKEDLSLAEVLRVPAQFRCPQGT